jgi:hypothetical protein
MPLGLLLLLSVDLLRPQLPQDVTGSSGGGAGFHREPNVFIVDDVAFIRPEHGNAIAAEVAKRDMRERYYLETRSDVLLRTTDVFERWTRLGLSYMFLGMEAIDAEGLDLYRKRVNPDQNIQALEAARKLGITVAINLIVDPACRRAHEAAAGCLLP